MVTSQCPDSANFLTEAKVENLNYSKNYFGLDINALTTNYIDQIFSTKTWNIIFLNYFFFPPKSYINSFESTYGTIQTFIYLILVTVSL